jgi:hypothetical protein
MDEGSFVGQLIEAVDALHGHTGLRYVFYDDALVSAAEALLDWIGPGIVFRLAASMDAPAAPPPAPKVEPARPDDAANDAMFPAASAMVILPSNLSARLQAIKAGRMRVFLTTTYDLMINGRDLNVDFLRDTRDMVADKVRAKFDIPETHDVHLFLSTGMRFTDRYNGEANCLNHFFGVIEGLEFKLYAVVMRRIDPGLLAAPVPEVCSCVGDMRQLLSPLWDTASDVGFSRVACLLGYLRYGGTKADALVRALAAVTDFAPLVCGCYRVMHMGVPVDGLTIATIAAAFLCVTELMAPADVPQPQLAEQVLLTACWLVHIRAKDQMPESWADPVNVRQVGDAGDVGAYVEATVPEDNFIFCYMPDAGEEYFAFQMHKPDADTFRGLYRNYVSFRPTPPLSLRLMSGVAFIRHTNEVTLLKLGEIKDPDPGRVSNRISMIDPRTAK